MATFATLYAEVGNLTPSTGVSRDKQFVNEAYADIASRRRWSWLESTTTVALVAGTKTYVLLGTSPVVVDFDGPISVTLQLTSNAAGKELHYAPPQLFEQMSAHVFTNSQPMIWTIVGGAAASTPGAVVQGGQQQIALSPPPSAVAGSGVNLIVRYWRSTASIEMNADSDVPLLPAQYHRMITMRACSIAMRRYLMAQDAVSFEQDFQEQLQAAIAADVAMRSGDYQTLAIAPRPVLAPQVPQTAATYDPQTRPYPQAV